MPSPAAVRVTRAPAFASACVAAHCSIFAPGLPLPQGVRAHPLLLPPPCTPARRRCTPPSPPPAAPQATAAQDPLPTPPPPPPGSPPQADTRAINGTLPFYATLVLAQALPFAHATSGLAGDVLYFTATAISCIVIGVRRAPLEPPSVAAALSTRQAIAAPFTASVFLFGCYLLLKYTRIDVSLVFNALNCALGAVCLKEALEPVFHTALARLDLSDGDLLAGPIQGENEDGDDDKNAEAPPFLTPSSLLATATAVGVMAAYLTKTSPIFVFSNTIAVGLAIRILSLIRPSSFRVAALLLTGLLCYDIFWVFGSEVMVSVATQIDSPAKLLFPRPGSGGGAGYPYALLGLGDVCIPGLFISLAQSLDDALGDATPSAGLMRRAPYFAGGVAAYGVGLVACFGANLLTNAAQPALLYLVPALLGSAVATAGARGELQELLAFRVPDEADADDGDIAKDGSDGEA